jgi:hypothetical protein
VAEDSDGLTAIFPFEVNIAPQVSPVLYCGRGHYHIARLFKSGEDANSAFVTAIAMTRSKPSEHFGDNLYCGLHGKKSTIVVNFDQYRTKPPAINSRMDILLTAALLSFSSIVLFYLSGR